MSSAIPDTRSKILEATWRLMEEQPGHGVRMSDIAKAVGISRQAVYLHFPARADLLIATTRYVDDVLDVDARLEPLRNAATGVEKLNLFISLWGEHVQQIYGVARALLAMRDTDEAAAAAWDERMGAVRDGCKSVIEALHRDRALVESWKVESATDLLWVMLSVRTWEQLTMERGWTQEDYVRRLQRQAQLTFVTPGKPSR